MFATRSVTADVTQPHRRVIVASAVLVTVAAFALGPVAFSPSDDLQEPAGLQIALFVLLSAIEAAALGAGVAFGLFGGPVVRRLIADQGRARVAHVALTWALASWWLHDNLHMSLGVAINGLLAVEYAFHVTVIAAVAALIWALSGPRGIRSR